MELTVNISIEDLIKIIKNLPANDIAKIKSELEFNILEKTKGEREDFRKFLLAGPVMSDRQHQVFKENRKKMNQWRTQ